MQHRIVRAVLCLALAALAFTVVNSPDRADAMILADDIDDPVERPLGPITVLGDSVLLGSFYTSPNLGDRLAEQGWGPIRGRAGVGYTTGYELGDGQVKIEYWIDMWRSQGWDAPNVIVNLGSNDAEWCNRPANQADDGAYRCDRAAIEYVLDRIGPGHRVWWPQITHIHADLPFNRALRDLAAERDDLFTWDWPAEMAAGGYESPDNIHLSAAGYVRRSESMADEVTNALARARPGGEAAGLPSASGPPSEFVPLTSTRVLDTRSGDSGPVAADGTVRVDASAAIPDSTHAVAAYVAATDTSGDGFLTSHACGSDAPDASTANYLAGQSRGALTILPVDADGTFCVSTHAESHVIVDVQGAFVADPLVCPETQAPPDPCEPSLRLHPLDTPKRLIDTRDASPATDLVVDVPDRAAAVAVNLTAISDDTAGYLVAYPCGDVPDATATVNYLPGDVIAGAAMVPVSADGTICVHSSSRIDVAVDLTGTFEPGDNADGGLAYVAAPPTRTFDVRDGTGGWLPIHGAGQTLDAPVAPETAAAVSGTLTIAFPRTPGYLTAWGCGPRPDTSNINLDGSGALANFVTVGVDAGELCIYANAATGSVFDTTGWWVDPDA